MWDGFIYSCKSNVIIMMSLFYIFSFISFLIPMVLIIVISVLSFRRIIDREKKSAFECGFDPKNMARMPFSLRFFLLAVIFLVFDIEIVLLIPLPVVMGFCLFKEAFIGGVLFLLILVLGLLHEWREGSLDWGS